MKTSQKAFVIGLTTALIMVATGIAWCQAPQPSTMPATVEIQTRYDFLPGMDKNAYAEFVKNVTAAYMKAPGLIEFRANRNLLGSPQARSTTVWQSLGDWANFRRTKEGAALAAQLATLATNIHIEIWGPSPAVPKPLRPGK